MIKLRVLELLKKQGKSKYWLWQYTNMSYQNFDNMIKNETKSIKYAYIELFCNVLNCKPNDLFEIVDDEENE